jgi:Ca-activated chloride channel family protein
MRIRTIIFAAALIVSGAVLIASATPGQQPSPTRPRQQQKATPSPSPQEVGEGDVVRVESDLVTLTATVTDSHGRFVADLKQSDFTVYEDGVRQELSYFSTGDRVPVSLGIVFDTSGSMIDKIEGVRDAVEHFVKSVAPGDEIFLIRFSDNVDVVQDFTDDHRRILRAVEDLEPQGSTALYDAVVLGLQKVTQGKHRKRALLLLTDGNDTASSVKFDAAVSLARRAEVLVYALGIGHGERGSFGHDDPGGVLSRQVNDEVDMNVLKAFADATGARAFYLEHAHAGGRDLVDEAAAEVANELKQQYTLGYRPTNRRRDGAFHQIKVEIVNSSLRVRTKRGYYATQS